MARTDLVSTDAVRTALQRLGVDLAHERFTLRDVWVGANVETEHTQDPLTATRIAVDHLRERPDYYTVLFRAEHPFRYVAALLAVGFAAGWLVRGMQR